MSKFLNKKRYKEITDYWQEFYVTNVRADKIIAGGAGVIGFCALCANHGIIETRDLLTPNGFPIGHQKHFCICPNGQALRFGMQK